MRRLSKGLIAAAALALTTAAAFGMFPHLLYGKRIAGQVVDADTGKPIPGAYVSFFWESGIIPSGFTGHNSRTICYHAAGTVTDNQGRFDISAWRKWSTYDVEMSDPLAIVYASHYVPTQIVLRVGRNASPVERRNERYALTAFHGNADARIHMLFWGIANHDCFYGGDSQKSLYPMLRAIYDEARSRARTKDQQDTVGIIARLAAKSAIAVSPNRASDEDLIQAFIRERLQ